MGSHFQRNNKFISAFSGKKRESGQSTVEYAVVLGAIVCIVVVLGALSNAVESGMFAEHAVAAASHNVQGSIGGTIDVFNY